MMSHPAMSLGDRLCVSRKGGTGGGGWVHPKGANSMAASGLSFEEPLVGAGCSMNTSSFHSYSVSDKFASFPDHSHHQYLLACSMKYGGGRPGRSGHMQCHQVDRW